ncbi:Hypothetical predicted protein [Olea europaea subsp. europaea]|uniref:Uncharacterized protein n=1 Tax=Olea europaea subsp. europaea TaxID=158383 RepID=A0A8S0Q2V4_OLEEU|nr:Hypothetical predicted protein [Olea europaea subsp. europaea]
MDKSGPHSRDKQKATEKRTKEKKKKFSSRDVFYSVDHATSANSFYTCRFLSQKANREILDMQGDANAKFAWVE